MQKKKSAPELLTIPEQQCLESLRKIGVAPGKRLGPVVAAAAGISESQAYLIAGSLVAKGKLKVEHFIRFTAVEA